MWNTYSFFVTYANLDGFDPENDIISFKENYPKTIPSIFLPTTHGSASEVTMWGTIWDMDEKKKYSISHPSLYPSIAI